MNKAICISFTTYLWISIAGAACPDAYSGAAPTPESTRYKSLDSSRKIGVNQIISVGNEVLDKVTNLIWRRCIEGNVWGNIGTGDVCTTGLTTCGCTPAGYGNSTLVYTWSAALNFAKTTATATGLPWRIPNHAELFSLADRACNGPALDKTWFPTAPLSPLGLFNTNNLKVWSSSPDAAGGSYAWYLEFDTGLDNIGLMTTTRSVRLVRNGPL